jgi:hypothetical protein
MSGDIPPLSQYAFMAWCLVKAQGQLYLFMSSDIVCCLPGSTVAALKYVLLKTNVMSPDVFLE